MSEQPDSGRRLEPVLGKKLWFGPRRMGWGWTPVSWEGVTVVLIALAAVFAPILLSINREGLGFFVYTFVVAAVVIMCCALKGTPPGGPSDYERYKRERRSTDGNSR